VLGVGLERLRNAITDVRGIAHRRGPVTIERLGWSRALSELTQDFSQHFRVELTDGFGATAPPEPYARELYRIVQECLTNAARHAAATNVQVSITRGDAGELRLSVVDDGHGFEPERVAEDERAGVGLRHLRERVEDLNGTFGIESRPGRTEVSVSLRMDPAT
jgi:two-component system NarL family sensor kinase